MGPSDRSGQGLFFLLVALSIGGYTSAIAISAAAAHLRVSGRVGVAVVTTAVVAALGTLVAGPVYGIITAHHVAIWALAWLYVRRHHPDRPRAAPRSSSAGPPRC